jgi:hypothetical protein
MASLLLMREKGQGGRCGDPIPGSASTAASSLSSILDGRSNPALKDR